MKAFIAGYMTVALLRVFIKILGGLPVVAWWEAMLPLLMLIGFFGVRWVARLVREEWWDIRREHQIEDRRRVR